MMIIIVIIIIIKVGFKTLVKRVTMTYFYHHLEAET